MVRGVTTVLLFSVAATACGGDLDLILTQGRTPVRLQLRFEREGKSAAELWERKCAALFGYLDRNGDGGLDEAEAARLPSIAALREAMTTGFTPSLGQSPAIKAIDTDNNGQASVAEVSAFYRRAGGGGPLVGAGVTPFTARLTEALVKTLDLNGDQTIDEAELRAAPDVLGKLDRNDDELVGAGELVARVLYPGTHGGTLLTSAATEGPALPLTDTFPVVILPADENSAWSTAVLKRRDKNQDGKLVRDEVGFADELFAKLDADNDGVLTAGELAAWRKEKPDATCVIRLHPAAKERPTPVSAENAKLENAALRLEAGGIRVLIRTDTGKLAEAIERVREHYVDGFKEADADSDGALTTDEIGKRRQGDWRVVVDSADRNGDGKLQREELEAWLALQEQLAQGQPLVTALDAGAGLFELLDTDHNGALSLAELRAAEAEVRGANSLTDGKLDPAKLPPLLFLTISHGYPDSPLGTFDRTGPAWFLAMDRNADGAVSRREFSGPAEVFTRLDKDQNNLLTATEAEAAGK